jgi:general secretion pathway protein G
MERCAKHTPDRRRRAGFSLLELMLVLAIIGALTAVAAWNLVGAGERAKVRVTKTSLVMIGNMLKAYQLDNETYPPDITTLVTAKYLEAQKDKDGFTRPFYYRPTGNADKPFDLISGGADGVMGTGDDIDYWAAK